MPTPRVIQRTYLAAAAREHAGRVADLGDQHDLPARRRALEPRGVRGQRVLHRRDGAVRGADRDRRRHRRAARVVPARDGDADRRRRCSTCCSGRSRRRSGQWAVVSILHRPRLHVLLRRGRGVAGRRAAPRPGSPASSSPCSRAGQIVSGAAMLAGSVAGGFIAQQTSLGVPFVLRGVGAGRDVRASRSG